MQDLKNPAHWFKYYDMGEYSLYFIEGIKLQINRIEIYFQMMVTGV